MLEGITYSYSPVFKIKRTGQMVTVVYQAERQSIVSIAVASPKNSFFSYVMKGKKVDSGEHEVTFSVPANGLYSITLVRNGEVYEKKLII